MRTAVIPAQIITVEDKIAGNLTLPQIVILIIPLILTLILFIALPPVMKFSPGKMITVLCMVPFSLFLALRIKGKIIMQWIIILLRYNLRPGFYLFNKNDSFLRTVTVPAVLKKATKHHINKNADIEQRKTTASISDLIKFEFMLSDPQLSLRFTKVRKGGLTIAIDQVKK